MTSAGRKFVLAAAAASLLFTGAAMAQDGGSLRDKLPDDAMLLKPGADSWPTYHGDYTGQRHSSLAQITTANAHSLSLAWAFQTGNPMEIKATPIVVDGILYFTVPDNVWAVDARSGRLVWHYTYGQNKGLHIGHRGVSAYKGKIFFVTPDAHVIALDAKTGQPKWMKEVADVTKGYWTTMSPLVVKNHVIVGVSGDFDNLRGLLKSFDPETGEEQWTYYTTPEDRTGGMTWMTGTYDPELNLIYWGTGNPTPVLTASNRPGDDPGTCALVAVNPDTGKLAWEFQVSPHDTHDWDAAETPMLVDGPFEGKPRKLLLHASRNGYFVVLDRATGKSLSTFPYSAVNWSLGLDKDKRPTPNPDKEPKPDGRLIAPDEAGASNYRAPSFDPKTGLFLITARDAYSIYFSKPADGTYGWSGADYGLWSKGTLRAIDYQTGKVRWSHDIGDSAGAGVLTTAGGIALTGDAHGNALIVDTANGKTLWHASTGGMIAASPMTYELDGRQYMVLGSGGVLFSWALPEAREAK